MTLGIYGCYISVKIHMIQIASSSSLEGTHFEPEHGACPRMVRVRVHMHVRGYCSCTWDMFEPNTRVHARVQPSHHRVKAAEVLLRHPAEEGRPQNCV